MVKSKLSSILLVLATALVSAQASTDHQVLRANKRYKREFASPTAQVAKRQNTDNLAALQSLQDAYARFIQTANATATFSDAAELSSLSVQAQLSESLIPVATESDQAPAETILPVESPAPTRRESSTREEQRASATSDNGPDVAITIGGNTAPESESSTRTRSTDDAPAPTATQDDSRVTSSSRTDRQTSDDKPVLPSSSSEDAAISTSSDSTPSSSSSDDDSITVGRPTATDNAQTSSSSQEWFPVDPPRTRSSSTPDDTPTSSTPQDSSIVVGSPTATDSSDSTSEVVTSTQAQRPVPSQTTDDSAPSETSITIGQPSSTADDSTPTTSRHPVTSAEADPSTSETDTGGFTIPVSSTRVRSSTVDDAPSVTSDDQSSITITQDEPTSSTTPRNTATDSFTRVETSSSETDDRPAASSDSSVDPDPATSLRPVPSSSADATQSPSQTSDDGSSSFSRVTDAPPTRSETYSGVLPSIGLPSVIGNVTDALPNSRPPRPPASDSNAPSDGITGVLPSGVEVSASASKSWYPVNPSRGSSSSGNSFSPVSRSDSVGISGAASQSGIASETSSSQSSSRTNTNSYYDFVPTSQLIINSDAPSTSATPTSLVGPTLTGASAADESLTSITMPSALPASLPAKIVPGDATPEVPDNSVLISILLNEATMSWKWMVQSPDTAAQVIAFVPQLLATALNASTNDVSTSALVAYQPLTSTTANQLMTVYLGTIPTDQLANLEAQIKTPNSALYQQTDPIMKQLSDQFIGNFPLLAFTSTEQATIGVGNGSSGDDAKDSSKDRQKTIIVAVIASFGSVIVLLLGFLGFRYWRNRKEAPALRQLQLGRSSPTATSPNMSQTSGPRRNVFSGMFTSHHYANSAASRHSMTSSEGSSEGGQNRQPQRGISWYSGRYTDFGDDENGQPRSHSVYGQAISSDTNPQNPFADRTSGCSEDAWLTRSEGVRKLKTGQVAISKPNLQGNSLML